MKKARITSSQTKAKTSQKTKVETEKLIHNILACAREIKLQPERDPEYFFKRPQTNLHLNYAMCRFVSAQIEGKKIGFKTEENDQRSMFNATYIQEHEEIDIHLRIPVADKWNNLQDYLDLDVYIPKTELQKILGLFA